MTSNEIEVLSQNVEKCAKLNMSEFLAMLIERLTKIKRILHGG